MSTGNPQLPEGYGKIPANYDFSTRKVNWAEYANDFILRTDAVWEKQRLKDYLRNYLKCFYFDKTLKKYQFFEPEDIYTILFEGWAMEDWESFNGFSPTGRTTCFQAGNGPKQRIKTSVQTGAVMQDYIVICALRFERWHNCDMVFHDKRGEYDWNTDQNKIKHYPCYRQFYEAQYACTDDLFDFLLELNYAKKANDLFEGDWAAKEIKAFPTVYDTPHKADRKTKTY